MVQVDETPEKHVEKLIRGDNTDEFISFLRSQTDSSGKCNAFLYPSEILNLCCVHRAVGCATALLEVPGIWEDIDGTVVMDTNWAGEGQLLPLQLAAQNLSWDLTVRLLKHGAVANKCDTDDYHKDRESKDLARLPLSMALKALCDKHVTDWTPEKSIYKLIYIFCLRDSHEALETIKSLADRTDSEFVEKISLNFVEKGEVIQLATLLMVAWDRLMPQSIENPEESLIGEHIWGHIGTLINQELQFMINCGPNCEVPELLKTKKTTLLSMWKIVKVLEKARLVIEEYRHCWRPKSMPHYEVPFDVAYKLYEQTELVLTPDDVYSDDIECLRPKIEPEKKAKLNEDLERYMSSWSISHKLKSEDEAAAKEFSQNKVVLDSVLSSAGVQRKARKGCCSVMATNCPPFSRSYHTFGASIVSFDKPAKNLMLQKKSLQTARGSSFSILLPAARLLLNAKRRVK